jgi:hypothetical protein
MHLVTVLLQLYLDWLFKLAEMRDGKCIPALFNLISQVPPSSPLPSNTILSFGHVIMISALLLVVF